MNKDIPQQEKKGVSPDEIQQIIDEEARAAELLGASTAQLLHYYEAGFEGDNDQTESVVVLDVDPQTGEIKSVNGGASEGTIVITTRISHGEMIPAESDALGRDAQANVNKAIALWNKKKRNQSSIRAYGDLMNAREVAFPAITETKNFEELFFVLNHMKTLKGISKEYTAEELIKSINLARAMEHPSEILKFITSRGGLRQKVTELIQIEQLKNGVSE